MIAVHSNQNSISSSLSTHNHTNAQARRYVASWVAEGAAGRTFLVYDGMKRYTFDVLVNQLLELGLAEAEVAEFSALFRQWLQGFLPPNLDLPFTPFGRAMAARCARGGV
jgi:cytochrome P450